MIKSDPKVHVVGSIAYDDITTPVGSKSDLLAGSAVYFSLANSIYSKVSMIGTVGSDFNEKDLSLLDSRNIDTSKIEQINNGKTFRWKGNYLKNYEDPETIYTSLGVFEDFSPKVDSELSNSGFIFLANISPDIQLSISEKLKNKDRVVGLDSMNHWILEQKEKLMEVMKNIDIFFLNKGEALKLANKKTIEESAKYIIENGPKLCIIKDGKNGSYLYSINGEEFFCPTYNIDNIVDPTGAGDTFAGGFFGFISKITKPEINDFKEAMIYGSATASFTIEGFGTEELLRTTKEKINSRVKNIKSKIDSRKK